MNESHIQSHVQFFTKSNSGNGIKIY